LSSILGVASFCCAQATNATIIEKNPSALLVSVTDENGIAVPLAKITLESRTTHAITTAQADSSGRWLDNTITAGTYDVTVEAGNFYKLTKTGAALGPGVTLDVSLHHLQEVGSVVNVTEATPGIDPQQTTSAQALNSHDIIEIPYPSTRDLSHIFPFLPTVVQDTSGQIHVAGSSTFEVQDILDDFSITDPSSGRLVMRVSPDAVRQIQVQSSRISAQFGRESGGVLLLDTRTGDNQFRASAVDFIPTLQHVKGISFNNWTPRATISGPIIPDRAWYYVAHENEFDHNIIKELPSGADTNDLWRVSDLAKVQVNVTPGNVLSLEGLWNLLDSPHSFLSPLNPQSATTDVSQNSYFLAAKDQVYFPHAILGELGVSTNDFRNFEKPLGDSLYQILPGSVAGNYYRTSRFDTRRTQIISNLYLPPLTLHGRHAVRFGADLHRISYDQQYYRNPISVLDNNGALLRSITFTPQTAFTKYNTETGGYMQDRWSYSDRLLIEAGARYDWDAVIRRSLVSPRISGTYMLTSDGNTKLSIGSGIFYDETNLEMLTRPFSGQRTDIFYDASGAPTVPQVTRFALEPNLRAPRFLNSSIGLERKLPGSIFAGVELLDRRGRYGFAYEPVVTSPGGLWVLRNNRRDRYDALQFNARRAFSHGHSLNVSYIRSNARSNEPIDFNIDNPVFGPQVAGPLPWDVPNHLVSWGWLPFVWHMDFAYSFDWHTGFPFVAVNQQQQIVGKPGDYRFPDYFTFNPALERRFAFHGYLWAIRLGIDDITGRRNAAFVNNNIDSPQFLTFSGYHGRTLNGRIRFLGKK
jgi:Carboxypeptidase regulatory-like domain/TonB dependent receptor